MPLRRLITVLLGLAWVASLAAAFLLGKAWVAQEPVPTAASAAPAVPPSAAARSDAASPGRPAATVTPPAAQTRSLLPSLLAIARQPSEEQARFETAQRLRSVNLPDLLVLFDAVQDLGPGPDRDALLPLLYARWGELDGPAALLSAGQVRGTRSVAYTQAALATWARQDPAAALQWAINHSAPEMNWAFFLAEPLVEAMGAEALDLVAETLPDALANTRYAYLNRLLQEGRIRDAAELAVRWSASIDSDQGSRFADQVAGTWARWDPLGAANWAREADLPAEMRTSALESVVHPWAAEDPLTTLAWLASLEPSPDLDTLRRAAFNAWVWNGESGPQEAATWLNAQTPTIADDPLRELLADVYQMSDPPAALAWANSLLDPGKRAGVAGWILSNWSEREPAAAAAWVAEHGPSWIGGLTPPVSVQSGGQTVLIQPTGDSPPGP